MFPTTNESAFRLGSPEKDNSEYHFINISTGLECGDPLTLPSSDAWIVGIIMEELVTFLNDPQMVNLKSGKSWFSFGNPAK